MQKIGWAGQWDRHRWFMNKANDHADRLLPSAITPPVLPEQSTRRLRSLDEFETSRFAVKPYRSRLTFSVREVLALALVVFIGTVIGMFI